MRAQAARLYSTRHTATQAQGHERGRVSTGCSSVVVNSSVSKLKVLKKVEHLRLDYLLARSAFSMGLAQPEIDFVVIVRVGDYCAF